MRYLLLLLLLPLTAFGQFGGFRTDQPFLAASAAEDTTITNSLLIWLTGTNGFNSTTEGANITSWGDLSGNGRNLVRDQAFTGYGIYSNSPFPCLTLTGGSGHYTNTLNASQPYTIIAVSSLTVLGYDYNVFVQIREDNAFNPHFTYYTNTSKFSIAGTAHVYGNSTTPTTNSPILIVGEYNGTSSRLRINGTNYITGASIGTGNISKFALGGSGGYGAAFWGKTFEVRVYQGIIKAAALTQLETDLKAKFGI